MFGIPQKHMKKAMESRKRNQIILTTLRETDGSPQTQRDRTKHAPFVKGTLRTRSNGAPASAL
jgi:hypothetical protein